MVRAFVEQLTVEPSCQSEELRTKKLPMPSSPSIGIPSCKSLAGAGFEPATFGL